jgi:starch synthase (maltosyl-transferring)
MKETRKIYNLYPKLVGRMDLWMSHLERIRDMGFSHVYINPIHAPGFSGSDYSVKNYYEYHPLFVSGEYDFSNLTALAPKGDAMLANVCKHAKELGLKMIMDLVINHTAIDSPLVTEHPDWFEHNQDGSIKNPGALDGTTWVSWGDLAQIDNESSPNKENLWNYWLDMIMHYCKLGIRGFRCDAAYHLPASLWAYLISKTKKKYPDAEFIAETLGCQTHELIETADSGFDCVMNSFKWWNFHDEWFPRLYEQWAGKYPSVAFPENHDTARFAEENGGRRNLAIMRYAISAWLFSGVATTMGFEYGFKRKIDVVQTNPSWWESPLYDISDEIRRIHEIKDAYPILACDTPLVHVGTGNYNLHGYTRTSVDGSEKVFVLWNAHPDEYLTYWHPKLPELMNSDHVTDISHGYRMDSIGISLEYSLSPGEVKLFYSGPLSKEDPRPHPSSKAKRATSAGNKA